MAKRALETFFVATDEGKKMYKKDSVVPADVAKGRDALVYDDGAAVAPRKAAAKKATED